MHIGQVGLYRPHSRCDTNEWAELGCHGCGTAI